MNPSKQSSCHRRKMGRIGTSTQIVNHLGTLDNVNCPCDSFAGGCAHVALRLSRPGAARAGALWHLNYGSDCKSHSSCAHGKGQLSLEWMIQNGRCRPSPNGLPIKLNQGKSNQIKVAFYSLYRLAIRSAQPVMWVWSMSLRFAHRQSKSSLRQPPFLKRGAAWRVAVFSSALTPNRPVLNLTNRGS